MASSDDTAPTGPTTAPDKPTNALGRLHWVEELGAEATGKISLVKVARELAHCATLAKGVHALSHLLCNNEAFAALQDACEGADERQAPLNRALTEGLFAALYKLSQQSEKDSMGLLEDLLEAVGE